MRVAIGLVGEQAAGKGTIASYLERAYGAKKLRFSTALTDILSRMHLPGTRENSSKLAECLRQAFGPSVLTDIVVEDAARSDADLVAIDGLRKPGDLERLAKTPGFRLVAVEAPMRTRYERARTRGEKPEDATLSFEEFEASHKLPTEVTIPELMSRAETTIDNSGTLDDLYAKLDALMSSLGVAKKS